MSPCADLSSDGEVICGLRKELLVKEYCLQQQLTFCAERHVDVAVLEHQYHSLAKGVEGEEDCQRGEEGGVGEKEEGQ